MISSELAREPGVWLLPRPAGSTVAIAPPGAGAGYWAGAPSAALGDDGIYLAYRLRRPLAAGRGYAVTVARSVDGVRFKTLMTIHREQLGADSLERPRLVRDRSGGWRLYLSCATPGTKHWRVELLEAEHPAEFDVSRRVVVLPGDARTGVKDPVIRRQNGSWQLWACCHPLADPVDADQMVTRYATSADGLDWTWHGTALSGRPGCCTSPGPPPLLGGGPSVRKNFGSFTADMNRLGWAARAAWSAVVPAFGAPMMKKSGRATGGDLLGRVVRRAKSTIPT
jgi:hypothetical protein